MIDLKKVITKYPECLESASKLRAYLCDLYPDEKTGLLNVIVLITTTDYYKIIKSSETIDDLLLFRWVKKIEDDYGYAETHIVEAIKLWVSCYRANYDFSLLERCFLSNNKKTEKLPSLFCPDCKHEVDRNNYECPYCGCPMEYFVQNEQSVFVEKKDYLYCSVSYLDGLKYGSQRQYYYISDDESICVGDHALVMVGNSNTEKEVVVLKVEHYSENYPFPPEITKHIIRKI